MPLPSYARATTSSALKAASNPNQHASPSKQPPTPKFAPKKTLKRPSTITPRYRESIAYNSDLYHIKPHDPSKPCHLANLPSELRTTIYGYALSNFFSFDYTPHPRSTVRKYTRYYIYPYILHICRAVRIEAAYTYYTSTPFEFEVRNLDFFPAIDWLTQLPAPHRALIKKNQHLGITILPYLRKWTNYPPANYLLDAPMTVHWENCATYGNLYNARHKLHFMLFCRLLRWFHYNDDRGLRWRYALRWPHTPRHWLDDPVLLDESLETMVKVFRMGSATGGWTRERVGGRGRKEAMVFLEALDRARGSDNGTSSDEEAWQTVVRKLREMVEKW